MNERRPADVLRTSHDLVPGTSRNWVLKVPHLELLFVFSVKNSNRCVNQGLIIIFCVSPLRVP